MFSVIVALAYIIALKFVFVITIGDTLLLLFANLLGVMLLSYLALLIDIIHPKLTWLSESQAVKQNINIVFLMLGTWALLALMIFVLSRFSQIGSFDITVILLLTTAGALTLALRYLCQKASVRLAETTN